MQENSIITNKYVKESEKEDIVENIYVTLDSYLERWALPFLLIFVPGYLMAHIINFLINR
jgi:hypothetical protein